MLTPHVAFSSDASLLELRRRAAEEVVRVLGGNAPLNPCNLRKA
jgi:D-3-phosphoglycerate dehydrogenase / 2-oxoglutarate reductase